jgi:hypothetical protein
MVPADAGTAGVITGLEMEGGGRTHPALIIQLSGRGSLCIWLSRELDYA